MIRIYPYGEVPNQKIFARTEPTTNVSGIVAEIIQDVRRRGDEALLEYTRKFDKAELTNLQVTEEEFQEALSSFDPKLKEVLQRAATNISKFHSRQKRNSFILNEDEGVEDHEFFSWYNFSFASCIIIIITIILFFCVNHHKTSML